jgi:nucleoside-diphosphate-sugar epimerase
MTRHVLVGWGYTAEFLADILLEDPVEILAISRRPPKRAPHGISHLSMNIAEASTPIHADDIVYYFVPPLSEFESDVVLEKFLNLLPQSPRKVIYVGSSGVYGDQKGQWVNEKTDCQVTSLRQKQRLSAELLLKKYCHNQQIPCALLRTAGIYGPQRIPLDAVYSQQAIIEPENAPFINHIYVRDLAQILKYLGTSLSFDGIVNIADGHPSPMGSLQSMLANLLAYPKAPEMSFEEVWQLASPMKKEFMSQNKKLETSLLKQILRDSSISIHTAQDALKDIIKIEKIK